MMFYDDFKKLNKNDALVVKSSNESGLGSPPDLDDDVDVVFLKAKPKINGLTYILRGTVLGYNNIIFDMNYLPVARLIKNFKQSSGVDSIGYFNKMNKASIRKIKRLIIRDAFSKEHAKIEIKDNVVAK